MGTFLYRAKEMAFRPPHGGGQGVCEVYLGGLAHAMYGRENSHLLHPTTRWNPSIKASIFSWEPLQQAASSAPFKAQPATQDQGSGVLHDFRIEALSTWSWERKAKLRLANDFRHSLPQISARWTFR